MTSLCSKCKRIFCGEWKSKVSVDAFEISHDGASVVQDHAETATSSDGPREDEDWADADLERDLEEDFYENPGWVQRSIQDAPEDRELREYESPLHHSVADLLQSAALGCQLCTMIQDRMPERYTGHETSDQGIWSLYVEKSSRLVGVVSVRPYDTQAVDTDLCLEISYFVDAMSGSSAAYFLTIELDLLPLLLEVDENPSHPVRESTVPEILAWVWTCEAEHEACKAPDPVSPGVPSPKLPARLIEISDEPSDLPNVRLINTSDFGPNLRYLTLSHCWGRTVHFSLRQNTISRFQAAIPWERLSKTFREAILFTQKLGFNYLWIDSLCIIQDSEADWLDQALSMGSIYSNSLLNLAATSSSNGDGGLFIPKSPKLANACKIEATWVGLNPGPYLIFDDTAWRRRIEDGVLNRRAWVLQERLLAPRTVHFAYDQVYWECAHVRASESYPTAVPEERVSIKADATTAFQSMRQPNHEREQANNSWLVIVQRYSECSLTKESDKLIALAGLAEKAQPHLQSPPSDYLAGLWRQSIPGDLLWHLESTGERYPTYQAPTWSWASVKGAVRFNASGARALDASELVISVRSVVVEPTDPVRPFGRVSAGSIEAAAPLYRVRLGDAHAVGGPSLQSLTINGRVFVDNETLSESLDHAPIYVDPATWAQRHATYFCRFATFPTPQQDTRYGSDGLLLERCAADERGWFRRFGWARLFHDEEEGELDRACAGSEALGETECLDRLDDGRYVFRIG